MNQVLELGDGGVALVSTFLASYLPGLSLGLAPVGHRRVLVPASTMRALATEYGNSQLHGILARAGATGAVAVDDSGAIALLRARDRGMLPARETKPIRVRGVDWHLDAIGAPQAWCVFRKSVTGRFGIVTAEFGNVTDHFGDVTDGVFVTA